MKWITRERPKIDRIACPWLIARFVDADAEFLFVPPSEVRQRAEELGATPFDVEGVELSHDGPRCSFDAILERFELRDPALRALATIVRGADTQRLDLAPECAGLLAFSLGLSRLFADDQEQLRHGMVFYDALYAWLTEARDETHSWNPQRRQVRPAVGKRGAHQHHRGAEVEDGGAGSSKEAATRPQGGP